jgi:hypothetical protein
MQALRMEIPGLPIREKRRASSPPPNQPLAQMPRPAKPPTFKGQNDAFHASWHTTNLNTLGSP